MTVSVLFRLKAFGMLNGYPNLAAYVARGEARPAFKRAFSAQLAVFAASQQACDQVLQWRLGPLQAQPTRHGHAGAWRTDHLSDASQR